MSEGRHAIVTTAGPLTVLAGGPQGGVFTDDEFYALPIVKEFGAFPPGYAAVHFGSDEPDMVRASGSANVVSTPWHSLSATVALAGMAAHIDRRDAKLVLRKASE